MSPSRSLVSCIGVVAVALALAGCAMLPGVGKPTSAAGEKPSIAQCWDATASQASAWTDWKGSAPVACGNSHTLYTYRVGTISGEPEKSWAASEDPTQLNASVQTKVAKACSISHLLPNLKWNQQLVESYFFVPTEAQWKAGARWARCDVGVLATGTTLDMESLAPLPTRIASLVDSVSSRPLAYEFCVNSPLPVSGSGPLDTPDAILADCTKHPQWKLTAHGTYPASAGAAFPAQASSNAVSSKLCKPQVSGDGEVWFAYLPTKSAWAAGDREIECWIGQKSADPGSGGAA